MRLVERFDEEMIKDVIRMQFFEIMSKARQYDMQPWFLKKKDLPDEDTLFKTRKMVILN